jgi:hypothetical protein
MGDTAPESGLDLTAVSLNDEHHDSALFGAVITNHLLALPPPVIQEGGEVDLTVGATGDINFLVGGTENAAVMKLDDVDKFTMETLQSMVLKAGDNSNTVKVSGTQFQYITEDRTQLIDAGSYVDGSQAEFNNNIRFQAGVTEFTGSMQCYGDVLANGHIIGNSLNVVKATSDGDSVDVGFGFRINDHNNLELYKYESNMTQRIAIFGEGAAVTINNAYSNFPVFGQRTYTPNDQLILGINSNTYNVWDTSGANVYYNNGKVAIGTNTFTNTDNYNLEVVGNTYMHDEMHFKDGIRIDGSSINNVHTLNVSGNDFRGTLSTILFDYIPANNNSTWLKNNQNNIALSGFNNDLNLANFYKGTGQTWFDKAQNTITLSSFSNDLVSQNNMSILEIQTSNITFLESGCNFTGQVSELQGISEFPLTSFSNDITHISNLTVDNFTAVRLDSNLVPYANDTVDLGTPENRFRDAYFSGNTIYIGDSIISSSNDNEGRTTLEFTQSHSVKINNLIFPDGTSMDTKAAATTTEGDALGDFDSIIGGNASSRPTFKIVGKYNFGVHHEQDEADKKYTWKIINIKSQNNVHNLIVPDSYGNVELTTNDNLYQVSSAAHTNVDVPFVNFDDGSGLTNNVVLSPYIPKNANDLSQLRNYDPSSEKFTNKFKADFDYYHNNRRYNNPDNRPDSQLWGYYSGEVNLDKYVNFNHKGLHVDNSKHYIMEYMQYYCVPFIKQFNDTEKYIYYIPNTIEKRLNTYYKRNGASVASHNVEDNNYPYNLFPKIMFKSWDNSVNDTEFQITPYDPLLKWTSDDSDPGNNAETKQQIISKFSDINGKNWIRKLLEITFAYIKYGNAVAKLTDDDETQLDNKANINASNLILNRQIISGYDVYNMIYINKEEVFDVSNGVLSLV